MSQKTYKVNICTSAGKIRAENEDQVFLYSTSLSLRGNITSTAKAPFMFGICDGMGGEAYGKVTAEIAALEAGKLYAEIKDITDSTKIKKLVADYANRANRMIVEKLAEMSAHGGTTVALVFVDKNDTMHCFSLGDSRIYTFSDGELKQISTDHTLAMKKYLMNIYSKDEAEKSEDSHKLTLYLGADINSLGLKPESYPAFGTKPETKIMLCSDGIYDMVSQTEIQEILSNDYDDAHADLLVEKALKNGGKDNASCIIVS